MYTSRCKSALLVARAALAAEQASATDRENALRAIDHALEAYQGYENYETWSVASWIQDDRERHEFWGMIGKRMLRNAPSSKQVREGTWEAHQAALFATADYAKDYFASTQPEQASKLWIWPQLAGAALSEVDWHEVAEVALNATDENQAAYEALKSLPKE